MLDHSGHKKKVIFLLKFCVFFVFAGRAYQHLVWDAPYRAFFWDEALLQGTVEWLTGDSWFNYATSKNQDFDSFINAFTTTIGVIYAVLAGLTWVVSVKQKFIGKSMLVGSFLLSLLAFLYCKEKFFHVGQFFEYGVQIACPILLYFMVFIPNFWKRFGVFAKVALALTFVCHGLYAVGYYPQPGNFVDMMIRGFGIEQYSAERGLIVFGALDFIVALLIFIPYVQVPALYYMFVWGTMTACARLVGNFYSNMALESFNQYTWEVVIRLPHGLLPLIVLYYYNYVPVISKKNDSMSVASV